MPLYNTNLYVMDPILKEANLSGSNYIFDGLDGDVVISQAMTSYAIGSKF